jgi:hypothetical protein
VSRRVRWIALLVSLATIATVVGFVAAVLVLVVVEAVLPGSRPSEGDTLRAFVPAVLAYVTWSSAAIVTLALGWRRIRRYR